MGSQGSRMRKGLRDWGLEALSGEQEAGSTWRGEEGGGLGRTGRGPCLQALEEGAGSEGGGG